jgi:hypothetical protein
MVTIIEFGESLIETEDLDPVYVMLKRANLEDSLLKKWLLAYWCFYHVGVASALAEAQSFYDAFASILKSAPRGAERRHFRGKTANESFSFFKNNFSAPESACNSLLVDKMTFGEISKKVQKWPYFGPWIAFKVADMIDRVLSIKVDFSDCKLGIYKEPALAAKLIFPDRDAEETANIIAKKFRHRLSPPSYDRLINIQEAETILCKYKSYLNGSYYVGKDSKEILHKLDGWGPLAESLKSKCPQKYI